MEFAFGDQVLDVDRRELRRDGEPVALQPQVFDLLVYLVLNRDRVVSKDDLLGAVWGGRIVSESTLTSRINAVRRAIGDNGEAQRLIRTVARKGVRFIGVVRNEQKPKAPRDAPLAMAADVFQPAPTLPDKPSIAVLPFANLSGGPEQEYFADGMVEEIITALSRIRWLFVIARNSSFTYKGQPVDVRRVGSELGVRYLLEGSVRRAVRRVRIAVQLIDTTTGAHIWAEHFDGSLEDIFDFQDKVAVSVAGVIEPALEAAEIRRSSQLATVDVTAYDLYLRAYAMHLTSEKSVVQVLSLLEQAIERDPSYAPALGLAAVCHMRCCLDGWSEDPNMDRRAAAELAQRALQAALDDPGTLTNAALALAYCGEDIGAMMALVDRALRLNPSFARGWYISGGLSCWAGQPDRAIEHVKISLRLSPRARVGGTLNVLGAAHFLSQRFDEAVPNLLLAIQEDPGFPGAYRYLAASYAHMGRLEEARDVVRRLRTITPLVSQNFVPHRYAEHRELLLSGLRLATGEET